MADFDEEIPATLAKQSVNGTEEPTDEFHAGDDPSIGLQAASKPFEPGAPQYTDPYSDHPANSHPYPAPAMEEDGFHHGYPDDVHDPIRQYEQEDHLQPDKENFPPSQPIRSHEFGHMVDDITHEDEREDLPANFARRDMGQFGDQEEAFGEERHDDGYEHEYESGDYDQEVPESNPLNVSGRSDTSGVSGDFAQEAPESNAVNESGRSAIPGVSDDFDHDAPQIDALNDSGRSAISGISGVSGVSSEDDRPIMGSYYQGENEVEQYQKEEEEELRRQQELRDAGVYDDDDEFSQGENQQDQHQVPQHFDGTDRQGVDDDDDEYDDEATPQHGYDRLEDEDEDDFEEERKVDEVAFNQVQRGEELQSIPHQFNESDKQEMVDEAMKEDLNETENNVCDSGVVTKGDDGILASQKDSADADDADLEMDPVEREQFQETEHVQDTAQKYDNLVDDVAENQTEHAFAVMASDEKKEETRDAGGDEEDKFGEDEEEKDYIEAKKQQDEDFGFVNQGFSEETEEKRAIEEEEEEEEDEKEEKDGRFEEKPAVEERMEFEESKQEESAPGDREQFEEEEIKSGETGIENKIDMETAEVVETSPRGQEAEEEEKEMARLEEQLRLEEEALKREEEEEKEREKEEDMEQEIEQDKDEGKESERFVEEKTDFESRETERDGEISEKIEEQGDKEMDRRFVDNLTDFASPEEIPQRLPSPPEPREGDMSPFDSLAPFDPTSPCRGVEEESGQEHNLGQADSDFSQNQIGEVDEHYDGYDQANVHSFEQPSGHPEAEFLTGEVEGETTFGVDGTAVTSTIEPNSAAPKSNSFTNSDEEEEEDEDSQHIDQGEGTHTTTEQTEPSMEESFGGVAVGNGVPEDNSNLMSMSMEGSFYDDGGDLIGGGDNGRKETEGYHQPDAITEESYSQPSSYDQRMDSSFMSNQDGFGQQSDLQDFTQPEPAQEEPEPVPDFIQPSVPANFEDSDFTNISSQDAQDSFDPIFASNTATEVPQPQEETAAPATYNGLDDFLETPFQVSQQESAPQKEESFMHTDSFGVEPSSQDFESSVDAIPQQQPHQQQEQQQELDFDSFTQNNQGAIEPSQDEIFQQDNQKALEDAFGGVSLSEPEVVPVSSSVDEAPAGAAKEEEQPAAAPAEDTPAAPTPAVPVAEAAAAAATSAKTAKTPASKKPSPKSTVTTTAAKRPTSATTKSTTAKSTTLTTTTRTTKTTATTNGRAASAKTTTTTTTTTTKAGAGLQKRPPFDNRPAYSHKTPTKSATSPTKPSSAPTTRTSAPLPSYAQPVQPRKPREAKMPTPEEKKKLHATPRPGSAPRTRPASATTSTTATRTSTLRASTTTTTTTTRTTPTARPKSSPTKLTNGTATDNKSPAAKTPSRASTVRTSTTTTRTETKASPATRTTPKPASPRTPATPKSGEIKSKIGSLDKANHTPGGGNVRITTKKTDFSNVSSKIGSKDKITHRPGGGNVKIENRKLKVEAKSKIGSLDNAKHTPAGGDKKIETQKTDWKAQSKIGSLDNARHIPGGGEVQIESHKLDFKEKAAPKIGSLDKARLNSAGSDVQDQTEVSTNGAASDQ